MSTTYQGIPLLDIIDRMDANIKIPCDDEDLNPGKEVCCKEHVKCLLYFLSITPTDRALGKVFCPELTGILQCISNVFLPSRRKITNITKNSIVIQVTDVPLQPLLHQIKA